MHLGEDAILENWEDAIYPQAVHEAFLNIVI